MQYVNTTRWNKSDFKVGKKEMLSSIPMISTPSKFDHFFQTVSLSLPNGNGANIELVRQRTNPQ